MIELGIGFRRALDVLVVVNLDGVSRGMVNDRTIVSDENFFFDEVRLGYEALLIEYHETERR